MKIILCSFICLCLCGCQEEIKEIDNIGAIDTTPYTQVVSTIISVETFCMRELYIIDERWQAVENAGFNYREDGTYPQEYVYVIGTSDGEEIFTVRKPNAIIEWRK